MENCLNVRNPAVRRLMKEASELNESSSQYSARPINDNLFEWHFTIRGPADTVYSQGIYHGKIIFPSEYPMKPPTIIILTPNGRFEVGQKICLSVSSFHPEEWRPCWGVRTILLALIGFMPTPTEGAIGSIDISEAEREKLAIRSTDWLCQICRVKNRELLSAETNDQTAHLVAAEAKEVASQMALNTSLMSDESLTKQENENIITNVCNTGLDVQQELTQDSVTPTSPETPVDEIPEGGLLRRMEDFWGVILIPILVTESIQKIISPFAKSGFPPHSRQVVLPLYDWEEDEKSPASKAFNPPKPSVVEKEREDKPLENVPTSVSEDSPINQPPQMNEYGNFIHFIVCIIVLLGASVLMLIINRLLFSKLSSFEL